jgi:2-amino-4-hydroxy-6-hydroxymethyldihydropteridine diphosphokinase
MLERTLLNAVYLGLGSNVGDRGNNIRKAMAGMRNREISIVLVSDLYLSKAYGFENQSDFYNIVVGVLTALPPYALLKTLQEVEKECGRTPTFRWGPREIDIDILLYGNLVLSEKDLTIPHPDFRNRDFVLKPMMDIGKMIIDPVSGKTVEELYHSLNRDTCKKISQSDLENGVIE